MERKVLVQEALRKQKGQDPVLGHGGGEATRLASSLVVCPIADMVVPFEEMRTPEREQMWGRP